MGSYSAAQAWRWRRASHSSRVISQISAGWRPLTKPRSSAPTTRIPLRSEILRDPVLATALGARRSGLPSTSNQ
ncbi:hypothetical protein G6F32_017517 [Rhizopus arrhizus]|nr:hypothetical protein G6F32_017517 [Rhizopus arrhizus]